MRFSRGADLNKRPGYWAQALPVFWCATEGQSIVDLCMPCTKAAWPICCEVVGEMILLGGKQEAEFPRQLQALLQQAPQQRDRRQQEQISDQGVAVARGRLEARLDRSLQRCYRSLRGSTLDQSSSAGARRSVHLPEPSRPGGHELASRASLPADGGGAQGMGWKSHGLSSPDAEHSGQLSANLPQPASPLVQNLRCSSQPKILDLTAPTR
jgi:hypothetical protein